MARAARGQAKPRLVARVRDAAPFPIASDESWILHERRNEILAACDVAVLKLPVVGGLRAAWRLAEQAAAGGVAAYPTSAIDTAVGRLAAAHLAAALPASPFAAGLATGDWLARDLAPLPKIAGGEIALDPAPGLGLDVSDEALQRIARGAPYRFERA